MSKLRFHKGELVYVWGHPAIEGRHRITKTSRWSNYPYEIKVNGKELLLKESEVFQIVYSIPKEPKK